MTQNRAAKSFRTNSLLPLTGRPFGRLRSGLHGIAVRASCRGIFLFNRLPARRLDRRPAPTARRRLRPHGPLPDGSCGRSNSLIRKDATASDRTDRKNPGSFCFASEQRFHPSHPSCPQRDALVEEELGSKMCPPRNGFADEKNDRAGVVPSFEVILSTPRLCGGERPLSSLTKALPWSP